ncbi:hypothetical protein [Exiguobacterium sp. LL15]|uniref:hypothetical protein n=1 Tax=Exiguobacterium sp. LL15 TaxID=2950547 RepID=UPI00210DA7C7|nr:hypothetical protein [Exiguobacterium sp. LL15]MCQ4089132.1 hypothetical protein [Exiguobacterium sp. LL15]
MPLSFHRSMTQVALAATLFSIIPTPVLSVQAATQQSVKQKTAGKMLKLSSLTRIDQQSLQIGKKTYQLSKAQATFFQKNKHILKQARLAFTYDTKGRVLRLHTIELNISGKPSKSNKKLERNLVLEGLQTTLTGNLIINADYVTIRNIKAVEVNVSDRAKTLVKMTGVQSTRLLHGSKTNIATKQAITKPKLELDQSTFQSVELNRKNTNVLFGNQSRVNTVDVRANGTLHILKGQKISRINTQADVSQLTLSGSIGTFDSESKQLNVTGTTNIDQLVTKRSNATLHMNVSGDVKQVTAVGDQSHLLFGKQITVETLTLEKSAQYTGTKPVNRVDIKGGTVLLDAPVMQLQTLGETALTLGQNIMIEKLIANASLQVDGGKGIGTLTLAGAMKELTLNTPTNAIQVQTTGATLSIKGTAPVETVTLDSSSATSIALPHITKIEETTTNKGTIDTGTTVVDEVKVEETRVIPPTKPPVDPPAPPPVTPPVTPPSGGTGGGGVETPPSFTKLLNNYLDSASNTRFEITEDVTIDGRKMTTAKTFYVPEGITLTLTGNIRTDDGELTILGEGTVDVKDAAWNIEECKSGLAFSNTLTWKTPLYVAGHTVHQDSDLKRLYHADKVIGSSKELADAIAKQNETKQAAQGELWFIQSGNYALKPNENITHGNQTGYYFPIVQKDLRIVGEKNTRLYGDEFSENGNWATQNLVTVIADGVTLEKLSLMPKVEVNKVIEVLGADFTLRDAHIMPNTIVDTDEFDRNFAGSIYFSTDKQTTTATIENTRIDKGRITTGGASPNLTLRLQNVELDYADTSVEGEAYLPIKNASGANIEASDLDVTVSNRSAAELTPLLANLPEGTQLDLNDGTYALAEQLTITKGITINGSGAIMEPSAAFKKTGSRPLDNLVSINEVKTPVQLNGLTFRKSYATGVQAYRSSDVTLQEVKSVENAAAGLIVNGSKVTAAGLHTSKNAWYGVNVDSGVNVNEVSDFTLKSGVLEEEYEVVSDVANQQVRVNLPTSFREHAIEGTTKKYWSTSQDRRNGVYVVSSKETKQYSTPQAAVSAAKAGDTILINGTIALKEQLVINKAITLKGEQDGRLMPAANFKIVKADDKDYNPSKNLISIENVTEPVSIQNLTIEKSLRSGIQAYQSKDVTLEQVKLLNNTAAGLVVNGSIVTANGLETEGNLWYGVNVDQGTGVTTPAKFILNQGKLLEKLAVYADKGLTQDKIEIDLGENGNDYYRVQGEKGVAYWNELPKGVYVQSIAGSERQLVSHQTLNEAVLKAGAGDTVWLNGDAKVMTQVLINKALNIRSFDGRAQIMPSETFLKTTDVNSENLITIDAGNGAVLLENLDVVKSARNGINVYRSSNVSLENVTSRNNEAAGLIVNGSTVKGQSFHTSGNKWYGVGVAPGKGVKESSIFKLKSGNLSEEYAIVASPSDTRNVSVTADYTEHKVEGASSYWTKRDAKRLPGFYLENKSTTRQFLTLHQAVNAAQAGDTVIVNGQHLLHEQLVLDKAITLQGENHAQLGRTDSFKSQTNSATHLLSIVNVKEAVQVKDMIIEKSIGSGINIYRSQDVTLTNVTSRDNDNAGIIVNRSRVTANNVNTFGNDWYGINVALGSGTDSDLPAHLIFKSGRLEEVGQIVSEDYVEGNKNIIVDAEGFTRGQAKKDDKMFTYWTNQMNLTSQ